MKCLSNHYNRSCSLLLCLFFFFCSAEVLAQACNPENPATLPLTGNNWTGWNSTSWPSAVASCSDCARLNATVGPCAEWEYHSHVFVSGNTWQCRAVRKTGGPNFSASNTTQGDGCPSGYTSNGSMCISDCAGPECEAAGTSAGENFWGGSKSGGGCSDGCAISAGGGCITLTNETTGAVSTYCSNTSFTGSTCTDQPDIVAGATVKDNMAVPAEVEPPQSAQDCSPGTGFAQINNETMCLPSGTSIDGPVETSTSSGGTTTRSSVTTINKDGTTTTNTTSSFSDGGGNVVASGSSTSTTGMNGVPGSNGRPNDNDPGPAPIFNEELPEEQSFNVATVPNPTISQELFSVAASCPAPIVFEAMGQELSFSFQPVCDLADIIRGIILLLSAIAAIRIVVTN